MGYNYVDGKQKDLDKINKTNCVVLCHPDHLQLQRNIIL